MSEYKTYNLDTVAHYASREELVEMYTELKEALVGDSDNWTHEELTEKALELVDAERKEGEKKHWLPKYPLQIGQKIIRAIEEHDEDFYEDYICKYTQYPDEEADHYWLRTEGEYSTPNPEECYDDDVDIAEMHAIIMMLEYSITNQHPHKVGVDEE